MSNSDVASERAYNFNPGPSILPVPVLEHVQENFLDYRGRGTSVMEISHRSDDFEAMMHQCRNRVRQLLDVPDDFEVLFLQGGASLQFSMVPMNLASGHGPVQVVDSGRWSGKKLHELELMGVDHEVVASSEDTGYDRVPEWDPDRLNPEASYVHICSNETVGGVQWQQYPDTGNVPLVADMASDILTRPLEMDRFGLIYAGAQKNMGPAGTTLVIVRRDLMERTPDDVPTMLRYEAHAAKDSIYNTAPVFVIYVVNLVLEWVQDNGGVEAMQQRSREKSGRIYDLIDDTDFYRGTAHPDSRSRLNVTFRLPSESLEERFIEQAREEGFIGLEGHRSVGGIRASLYNALPMEAVEALVEFMRTFESRHG